MDESGPPPPPSTANASALASTASFRDLSRSLTEEEFHSRLRGVLEVAQSYLVRAEMLENVWGADESSQVVRLFDKFIIETSVLALLSSRVSSRYSDVAALTEELSVLLAPWAYSERNRTLLSRYPYLAASLGLPHIVLTRLGKSEGRGSFDDLVHEGLGMGCATERPTFRIMDLCWVQKLWGIQPNVSPESLLGISIATSNTRPFYMTREDAYALTHTVMYLTDFGRNSPPRKLPLAELGVLVDASLAWNLLTEDLDILIELLLSISMVPLPWSPYARMAWDLVHSVWDSLGFLPSPTFKRAELDTLTGDDAEAYVARNSYHTDYVGGLLCLSLLQPVPTFVRPTWGPTPGTDTLLSNSCKATSARVRQTSRQGAGGLVPMATDQSDCSPMSRLLARLLVFSHEKPWWPRGLESIFLSVDEALMVLGDSLLIHAAREYDLDHLVGGVLDLCELGIPRTPTLEDAARFLLRQEHVPGFVGAQFAVPTNRERLASAQASHHAALALDALARMFA